MAGEVLPGCPTPLRGAWGLFSWTAAIDILLTGEGNVCHPFLMLGVNVWCPESGTDSREPELNSFATPSAWFNACRLRWE